MQAEKKTIKSNIGKAIFFTSNESCDKLIFFSQPTYVKHAAVNSIEMK